MPSLTLLPGGCERCMARCVMAMIADVKAKVETMYEVVYKSCVRVIVEK